MSSDKKQIELTVLVLDIENKREFGGVVVTGYSRSFLELVRIFVEENTLVSIGQNLYYIKEGLNDGIVYPQAGSVRAANVEDVKLSSGRIYVPVSVAIHNATTAFSEFYGFIDIYNYERKEWLEEIYNTTITVRQTTDENLPIFEASEKLIPCPNMDPKDKKRIIEELKKFEVKMRINNRPTNMGRPGFETSFRERDVPSVSTRRRQNYEPRKRSYEEIRKIVKKQYYNCLVVSRFTNDKSFGIVHTKFGAATMLEVNDHGPNSQDLDVGDWCSASLDVQKSGRLSMTKVNCRDSIGRNAHVVENGIIYLFEEIDLRDNGMKNFRGSNSHFVIERTNNDLLRNILVPAKFQKFDGLRFEAKIKYVLEARDDLCWEIVEVIGEIPDKVSYTSWVQSTPDLHPHLNGIPLNTPERLVHHPDEVEIINDSSDDEPASANDLKKEYSDMKEDKNPGRTPPWQEKGFYKYEQNPMNMEYRPESQTSRSSRNPQDIGFFANKLKSGDFILFSDKLKASVYCSKIVASNAHLGDLRYIETMPLSQIFNGCYYQAEFVAHHGPELSSDVKIIGDSAQYLAVVNLRDPLKLSRLGFPLYESDVGKVMLTLRTTLEFYEEQDYRHFLKDFHGKPGSDKMACWCSFDYAEVPLVCVDRNCYPDDPQVVQAFHWRVSHICGTMHAYSIQEKAMKDRNLHENRKTYEEYDDIARQKELNRRNGAYAGNAGGSGMNDYMSGRSSYSSVRPDSSASNVPPNAHFPPPNVPVPHLPNPGFNESFNVPLSQGYSNTSDHYSHSGRGGPQPPYSNDYPSTRQTSSNMNDSRTPTQHSPVDNRALQDEINELKIALGKCRVELKNATKIVGAIGDDNEIRACMKSNNYDLYDTCERFLNKIYIENPTWRPVSSKSSANGSNRH